MNNKSVIKTLSSSSEEVSVSVDNETSGVSLVEVGLVEETDQEVEFINPELEALRIKGNEVSQFFDNHDVDSLIDYLDCTFTDKAINFFSVHNKFILDYLCKQGVTSIDELTEESWRSLPWNSIIQVKSISMEQVCNSVVFMAWNIVYKDIQFPE